MARILVIEDSAMDRRMLQAILAANHEMIFYEDASEIVERVQKHQPEIVLLDVNLPSGDGFQACTILRNSEATASIPIIFVSGKTAIEDRVQGLSLGADDYVTKPFNPMELKARIDNKLRKAQESKRRENVLIKGALKILVSSQKAVLMSEGGGESPLDLTATEFRLLVCFAQNEGQVISRQQLLDKVWGENVHVSDRTVDRHVSSLRRKCASCEHYFEALYGAGYRFDSSQASSHSRISVKKSA